MLDRHASDGSTAQNRVYSQSAAGHYQEGRKNEAVCRNVGAGLDGRAARRPGVSRIRQGSS